MAFAVMADELKVVELRTLTLRAVELKALRAPELGAVVLGSFALRVSVGSKALEEHEPTSTWSSSAPSGLELHFCHGKMN